MPAAQPAGETVELTPWQKTLFDNVQLALGATRALVEPSNQLKSAHRTGYEVVARHACLPDAAANSLDGRVAHAIRSGSGNCVSMAMCAFQMLAADPALRLAHMRVLTSKALDHAVLLIDDVVADPWDPKGVPYLQDRGNPLFNVVLQQRRGVACEKLPGHLRGTHEELGRHMLALLLERRQFPDNGQAKIGRETGARIEAVLAAESMLYDVDGMTPTDQTYRVVRRTNHRSGDARNIKDEEIFSYGHRYAPTALVAELGLTSERSREVRRRAHGTYDWRTSSTSTS